MLEEDGASKSPLLARVLLCISHCFANPLLQYACFADHMHCPVF